jgi:hypothetical protein
MQDMANLEGRATVTVLGIVYAHLAHGFIGLWFFKFVTVLRVIDVCVCVCHCVACD